MRGVPQAPTQQLLLAAGTLGIGTRILWMALLLPALHGATWFRVVVAVFAVLPYFALGCKRQQLLHSESRSRPSAAPVLTSLLAPQQHPFEYPCPSASNPRHYTST